MGFREPGSTENVPSNPNTATESTTLEEYQEDTNTRDFGAGFNDAERYYYPLDLDDFYPGVITFQARSIPGKDIGSLFGEGIEAIKKLGDDVFDFFTAGSNFEATSKAVEIITDKPLTQEDRDKVTKDDVIDQSKLYELALKRLEEAAENVGTMIKGTSESQPVVVNDLLNAGVIVGNVKLPLPADLRIVDQLTYSGEANLGIIGGFAEAGISNSTGAITQSMKSAKMMGQALFTQQSSKEISSLVLNGIKNFPFVPEAVGQGASSASRIATNPNIRNLFEKVALRNFTFTFKMVPTSRSENEMINNLIKFFRVNSYPETVSAGGIPVGYVYPNVFDIKLEYRTKPVATKLLPCYLRTVTAAYNPTGAGMHDDGGFNEYEISLDFQEVLTLDRKKIEEGY